MNSKEADGGKTRERQKEAEERGETNGMSEVAPERERETHKKTYIMQ